MEKKPYSKMWTDFETQCTGYSRLRTGLPFPKYITRGYNGFLKVFKTTEDHSNPEELMTIYIRASKTKAEVGFFKKSDTEYLVIGGNEAWNLPDHVKKILGE